MKIIVYKGFSKKFLSNIKFKPLIENSVDEKTNVLNFNSDYKNKVTMSILSLDCDKWITYEEFSFCYDFLMLFSSNGQIEIEIVNNNIYPGIYPINMTLTTELYEEYKMALENKNEKKLPSDSVKKLSNIYADINYIDDGYYISYFNNEYRNENIKKINNYYDANITLNKINNDNTEYVVDIGDDLNRYIKHINNIINNNYKIISYKMVCDSNISRNILKSLMAFCKSKNINDIYEFKDDIISTESVKSELIEVAEKIFKKNNFQFRPLPFYKNPDISRELENLSQGDIMEYIVNEAKKAYSGLPYRDIFITAPTGAGKSLIFQIPSVYLAEKYNKLIIIIEPLKGLMNDQQENLDKCGYKKSAYLNSDIATLAEREKIIENIKNGNIDLLYVSPETLLSHSIDSLIGEREIGLMIIDEAHIVTTWGVGFRPDYWYLGTYINKLRNSKTKTGAIKKSYDFPVFACTATAVNGGKDDSVSETFISLYMRDPIKKIGCVKRKDISFEINTYEENKSLDRYLTEKVEILGRRINKWIEEKDKSIVYCPYSRIAHEMKNGEKDFRNFDVFKNDVGVYTGGGIDKFEKNEYMNKFRDGEINVMYATKAFGMGIDISDIHNVYHYAVTGGLSDYVQEIGRAARKKDMTGKAIVDYFKGDMKYMNNLFGMSQIRQYHIKRCLSIIYDAYQSKKNRNFMINPKMFSGVFGKYNDDSEIENKLKIVLLMLEKDLYDTFGIYVLVSRPGALFTKTYVSIDRDYELEVLNGKYGKYFKRIASGRLQERQNEYSAAITDVGDIFELDLKAVWEDYNSNMSFAMFKYYFFGFKNSIENSSANVMPEIRYKLFNRVRLNLTSKYGNFDNLYTLVMEEIDFITNKLSEFGREFFTKEEFKNKLVERYKKISKAEIIANSYFDIIDPLNRCVKKRNNDDTETYQISNGSIRTLAESIIRKSGLMKKLRNIESEEYSQFMSDKSESDMNLLKLLSLLDLVSFEILGGNSPEIFIRLNAPDKIKNIVEDRMIYKNRYVELAKEKHYRSVKIIDYFFRNFDDDDDRWDFIERYFLGEDLEAEIDSKINEEKFIQNYEPISKYIDVNNAYPLDDFKDWKQIKSMLSTDEKYKYYIKLLEENNIKIPDYAWTPIVFGKIKIESMFIYLDRNIIISTEFISYEALEKAHEKGWIVVKIDEVENNIDFLRGQING